MDDGRTGRQIFRQKCPAPSSRSHHGGASSSGFSPQVTRMLIFQAPPEAGSPDTWSLAPEPTALWMYTHMPRCTHHGTHIHTRTHAHQSTHTVTQTDQHIHMCTTYMHTMIHPIYTPGHMHASRHIHIRAYTRTYTIAHTRTHTMTHTPQGMDTTSHLHAHQEMHSFPSHGPISEQPEQTHWCRNTTSLSQRLWSVDTNENTNGWET